MKKRRKKLRKNSTALISAFLILVSGFLFQLFHTSVLGESLPSKNLSMFDYILTFFNGSLDFSNFQVLFGSILVILFLVIFLFYLLNGLGIIYNRYSRYASYLSFVYFIVGLIIYKLLNKDSISMFGVEIAGVNLGFGVYFIPIIGVCYLLFNRTINSKIKF